jgi:hypothetical protein
MYAGASLTSMTTDPTALWKAAVKRTLPGDTPVTLTPPWTTEATPLELVVKFACELTATVLPSVSVATAVSSACWYREVQ